MNVKPIHNRIVIESAEPNEALIAGLEGLVEQARSGQLQTFIGCGFSSDGLLIEYIGDFGSSMFKTLGGLEWLVDSYKESCREKN